MDNLINQLKTFAVEDFPIGKVSEYLNNYSIYNENFNDYIHFKDEKYCRNLIHKEADFEIMLVCWKAGQVAPIHGHEGEKCWMRVESGALQISNYTLESIDPLLLNMADQIKGETGHLDGPAEIHSVENVYSEDAVSLHVYAKPFSKCDIYCLDTGTVERVKLVYDSIDKQLC